MTLDEPQDDLAFSIRARCVRDLNSRSIHDDGEIAGRKGL
jgi:hypothetical protein